MSARLLVLLSLAMGCRQKAETVRADPASRPSATTTATPRPSVVIARHPDDGWGGDFEIPAKVVRVDERYLVVRGEASVDGKPVDIEVIFEEPNPGLLGGVEVKPVGSGGDALLLAMARVWKQGARARVMRSVRGPAAWLSGKVDTASSTAIHTKLFLDDYDAEVFINWNPTTSMIEVFEKDEEYRAGVITAFTTP